MLLALLAVFFALPEASAQEAVPGAKTYQERLKNAVGVDGGQLRTTGPVANRYHGLLQAWNDAGRLRVVDAGSPLPVQFVAAFPGAINLVQVGGNLVTAGAGNVAAGTQRMTLANNDPAVADLAAIEVLLTTIEAQLDVLDDWDDGSDRANVVVAGPLGGGLEAAAVLVTVANDSTGLLSVDDNGGSLTVDIDGFTVGNTDALGAYITTGGWDVETGADASIKTHNLWGDDATIWNLPRQIVISELTVHDVVDGNRDRVRSSGADTFDVAVGLEYVAGTATAVDQGQPDAGTLRTVEAQSNAATHHDIDPNQNEVAADISANTSRRKLLCQNVGTDIVAVNWCENTGTGTHGVFLAGGTAAFDGTGGSVEIESTCAVWLYDVNNTTNADTNCIEETM